MRFRDGAVSLTAIDPGGTTGIAMYDAQYIRGSYFKQQYDVMHLGPGDHYEDLYSLLERRRTHNSIVIAEGFDNRDNPAARITSAEYNGVVKLWRDRNPDVPVVFQTAALGKGFWTDDKLKKVDLYFKGFKHGRDAMRHLLHYMAHGLDRKDLLEALK
jgi:hypothetical protein